MLQYEDELLQALAQSVMPLDRLIGSADTAAALSMSLQEQPVRQQEDLLAQELLSWFKHEFFTWVRKAAVLPKLHPDCQPYSFIRAIASWNMLLLHVACKFLLLLSMGQSSMTTTASPRSRYNHLGQALVQHF